jgi:D-psicose/D-tagatose/L-ribulose 3-epimerase
MRIVLCNEVVRELSFERQCAFAASAGYDALEIAPFTLGDKPHHLSSAQASGLRRIAEDAGVAISGLHILLQIPVGLSISEDDDVVA